MCIIENQDDWWAILSFFIVTCHLAGSVFIVKRHQATHIILLANYQLDEIGKNLNNALSILTPIIWSCNERMVGEKLILIRGYNRTDLLFQIIVILI